jgi:hypothetical protein
VGGNKEAENNLITFFICGLIFDALSKGGNIAPIWRKINKLLIIRDMERSNRGILQG